MNGITNSRLRVIRYSLIIAFLPVFLVTTLILMVISAIFQIFPFLLIGVIMDLAEGDSSGLDWVTTRKTILDYWFEFISMRRR